MTGAIGKIRFIHTGIKKKPICLGFFFFCGIIYYAKKRFQKSYEWWDVSAHCFYKYCFYQALYWFHGDRLYSGNRIAAVHCVWLVPKSLLDYMLEKSAVKRYKRISKDGLSTFLNFGINPKDDCGSQDVSMSFSLFCLKESVKLLSLAKRKRRANKNIFRKVRTICAENFVRAA